MINFDKDDDQVWWLYFQAYNTLLKRIGSEKSLPGLEYSEKQMFWIAFASVSMNILKRNIKRTLT